MSKSVKRLLFKRLKFFSEYGLIAGLSLTIPARQKVAICGRSGSGKSTLIMGLMRMAKKIQVISKYVDILGESVWHI